MTISEEELKEIEKELVLYDQIADYKPQKLIGIALSLLSELRSSRADLSKTREENKRLRETLIDVRSELSSAPKDYNWCIDTICEALKGESEK